MTEINIKEDYKLSHCCSPMPDDAIIGYYSHDNFIKIHKIKCENLENIASERLISVEWHDILISSEKLIVDDDYTLLLAEDFQALLHHEEFGIDYSHVLAKKLLVSKQKGFEIHERLKTFGLIERVEAKIVQYRKGIVPNKWIKHRNHTYYDLTEKGKKYLQYYKERRK